MDSFEAKQRQTQKQEQPVLAKSSLYVNEENKFSLDHTHS